MGGTLAEREQGRYATGEVFIRSFDYGVATQLGGTVQLSPDGDPKFFVTIPGVTQAAGLPGVPIYFQNPDDGFQRWLVPHLLIRREDPQVALSRRHAGATQYAASAPGAGLRPGGPTARVTKAQALPMDITYAITAVAQKQPQAQALLRWVLARFRVEGRLDVVDSIGDTRQYDAYLEGVSSADDIFDVGDRTIGFVVSVRVEGELDIEGETTGPTVFTGLTPRVSQR